MWHRNHLNLLVCNAHGIRYISHTIQQTDIKFSLVDDAQLYISRVMRLALIRSDIPRTLLHTGHPIGWSSAAVMDQKEYCIKTLGFSPLRMICHRAFVRVGGMLMDGTWWM